MWRLALAALALASPGAAHAAPRRILFVGNSFTFGAGSLVERYRPDSVADLDGDGVGGVPALVADFAEQAGLDWRVSLVTEPGRPLEWHWRERRAVFDRRWDAVVLQGYSTLDPDRPGDPARHARAAGEIAAALTRANPAVEVALVATWSRADQVYPPAGHWHGLPVARMAEDLQRASLAIRAADPAIDTVVPVGLAWNAAFAHGLADADPYDGIAAGQLDLWAADHYHASTAGYYLTALTIFGRLAGYDPRALGAGERTARALGLAPEVAAGLQAIAARTLAATADAVAGGPTSGDDHAALASAGPTTSPMSWELVIP